MADSNYQMRMLKQLLALLAKDEGGKDESTLGSAKDFLSGLAGLAGKGKDELVQSICREIGQATAAVLKEPLAQLMKDRKLQVTIELVPLNREKNDSSTQTKSKKTKPRRRRP